MPFTFAHPAIVLPLARLPKRAVSLTALVIGSMAPDFEYFIRMRVMSIYSHKVPGLFYFDLPLGWLLLLIYVFVVKTALMANLPKALNERLSGFRGNFFKGSSAITLFTISVSILIGASSHLLWDAFTHPHGYFVEKIPLLTSTIQIAGHAIYIFKVAQHSSTVIGFVIIGIAIKQLPVQGGIRPTNAFIFWAIIGITALIVVILRIVLAPATLSYGDYIVTGIAGWLIGLIMASWHFRPSSKQTILQ